MTSQPAAAEQPHLQRRLGLVEANTINRPLRLSSELRKECWFHAALEVSNVLPI